MDGHHPMSEALEWVHYNRLRGAFPPCCSILITLAVSRIGTGPVVEPLAC
jgi:hypothetical protein